MKLTDLTFTDKIQQIPDENTRREVMSRLSKNNETHRKPDTVIERISNLGPFLLAPVRPTKAAIDGRLVLESKEIPDTNKPSKGIIQNHSVVEAICHITQFDYFRQASKLKTKELYDSRSFAGPVSVLLGWLMHLSTHTLIQMIMPLVTIGAKFYMSLTSRVPAQQHDSKNDLYSALAKVEMLDPGFHANILDKAFFNGLDKLFVTHLLPCFQALGVFDGVVKEYDQNKAPSLEEEEEDDDDDDEKNEVPQDIVSLDWIHQFKEKYIPAVMLFVDKWVVQRKTVLKAHVEALDVLPQKILQFLTIGPLKTGIRSIPWHTDKLGVPLVTPALISSLVGELNAVEDAAISVSPDPQVP